MPNDQAPYQWYEFLVFVEWLETTQTLSRAAKVSTVYSLLTFVLALSPGDDANAKVARRLLLRLSALHAQLVYDSEGEI